MTKYKKANIKFSSTLLNELANDKKSCVKVKTLKHHLSLHPYHLTDVNNSLKEIINRGIARFDNKLGGILLGFKNINLASDLCHINYDSCYLHVDVSADFYIFKPKLGKELKAIVTKLTRNTVSCLLYNAFNISIPRPRGADEWIGDNVKPGFEVLFRISQIRLSGNTLPYICGTLSSILTSYDDPEQNDDEEPNDAEAEMAEDIIAEANDLYVEVLEKKKKKSKKTKSESESEIEVVPKLKKIKTEPESETEVTTSKSKKIKQEPESGVKKSKKLKVKKEKIEPDVFLDELNLDELFNNDNLDMNKSISMDMADNDYRSKRKRISSTSTPLDISFSEEKIKLSQESNVNETPKKKKKKLLP